MTESEKLFEEKEKLAKERDLCAELYNVWIEKLHEFQTDPVKYEMYVDLINNMEPYGQLLKEEIRDINRKICDIEGVDNIEDTPYVHICEAKYGPMTPNDT